MKTLKHQYIIVYNWIFVGKECRFLMGYSRRQGGSYEGRRGHGKGVKRYPVEVGEELEVNIVELSPKEEGIARVQGLVVHVADAKIGDHVKIKITRVGGTTAEAKVIK
jgi:predicted RNA-binding protein with TRAM domain